jgi:hypothetical protein
MFDAVLAPSGGSDSLSYMSHANDDGWALVFANDCDGNAERGAVIVRSAGTIAQQAQIEDENK